ncbi:MAG: hypothetical protein QOD00_3480, partial [Blastocatellia bacterium]|nr:hypothetical protein [Blastocatellia bacterium]
VELKESIPLPEGACEGRLALVQLWTSHDVASICHELRESRPDTKRRFVDAIDMLPPDKTYMRPVAGSGAMITLYGLKNLKTPARASSGSRQTL